VGGNVRKILIANRGEIACRVIRTARRLGIHTVAVYSDADRDALHVSMADEAVHIGAAAPRESYLCGERIIAAARATGAQAIHPGYGFLSENAEFAPVRLHNGLVFIGPPPRRSRRWATNAPPSASWKTLGVPWCRATTASDQDDATLRAEAAESIGFPVLLKAAAGGGGKGMRLVSTVASRVARGAGRGAARIRQGLRRQPHAGREMPDPSAPCRNPGLLRQPRQRRLPVRARLFAAAAPPESGGGGAGARHDAGGAQRDGTRGAARGRGRSVTAARAQWSSCSARAASSISWK
jgi:hypothetical protein